MYLIPRLVLFDGLFEMGRSAEVRTCSVAKAIEYWRKQYRLITARATTSVVAKPIVRKATFLSMLIAYPKALSQPGWIMPSYLTPCRIWFFSAAKRRWPERIEIGRL